MGEYNAKKFPFLRTLSLLFTFIIGRALKVTYTVVVPPCVQGTELCGYIHGIMVNSEKKGEGDERFEQTNLYQQ